MLQPLGRNIIPFPMVYSLTLHGGYIQMAFFPRTPKWEFQNYDSYCPKTLDVHIF